MDSGGALVYIQLASWSFKCNWTRAHVRARAYPAIQTHLSTNGCKYVATKLLNIHCNNNIFPCGWVDNVQPDDITYVYKCIRLLRIHLHTCSYNFQLNWYTWRARDKEIPRYCIHQCRCIRSCLGASIRFYIDTNTIRACSRKTWCSHRNDVHFDRQRLRIRRHLNSISFYINYART